MDTNAKPAGANGGPRTITVCNWKPLNNGSLRGFLTLTLPSGVVIHNCQLIETGGRRWVGLPSRRFLTAGGKAHYEPIIEFATRKARRNFERTALEAVKQFLKVRANGRLLPTRFEKSRKVVRTPLHSCLSDPSRYR